MALPRPVIAPANDLPEALSGEARRRLWIRQADQIMGHAAIASLLATAFAAVVAIFFADAVGADLARAWFVAKVLAAAPRTAAALCYRQPWVRERLQRRPTWIQASITLDGLVWGAAGLAVTRLPVDVASALVACLAVVATVATLGLQVHFRTTVLFAVSLLVPTMAGLLMRVDGFGFFAAGGLALLVVQLCVSAWSAEKRVAREFLSLEQLSQALRLQSETAERLEETSEQLRREGAVKSRFLGTMSHELRTPLHGILGVTAMMKRGRHDAATRSRLDIVQAQGEHLLALIGALLDVARIESGRLDLHFGPFDLAAEVRQLSDLYRERTASSGVAFTVEAPLPASCWVMGDAARVRQVLHNLLGNAVKFTREGWIRLAVARGERGETVFSVADTGPGIPAADHGRIFEAFGQTASAAVRPDIGTGLGLAIARELAQAMGGEITVESIVGVGSKFVFRAALPATDTPLMPEEENAPPPAANAGSAPLRFAGYRVLVAEDNDVNALIVEAALQQLGVEVSRASTGRDAVAAVMDVQRPHVVLMDLRMPDLDGLAATREIRAREAALRISHVPVIALTANSSREDVAACEAAGMDGFLSKPFSEDGLARVLAAHLGPGVPFLGDENDDLGGGHEAEPWAGRSGAVH